MVLLLLLRVALVVPHSLVVFPHSDRIEAAAAQQQQQQDRASEVAVEGVAEPELAPHQAATPHPPAIVNTHHHDSNH